MLKSQTFTYYHVVIAKRRYLLTEIATHTMLILTVQNYTLFFWTIFYKKPSKRTFIVMMIIKTKLKKPRAETL